MVDEVGSEVYREGEIRNIKRGRVRVRLMRGIDI